MDHYDAEKTARVWARVQGRPDLPPPPPPMPRDRTIEELIEQEQKDAADFQRLARRYTGPERVRLLQIAQQERSHAAFLRTLLPRPRR